MASLVTAPSITTDNNNNYDISHLPKKIENEETVVLIGIPSTTANKSNTKTNINSPYETYIGGTPGYYKYDSIVNKTIPLCKHCKAPLILISQIYAPVEYHRSLLIFGCNNIQCNSRNNSWKVYRTQDVENSEDSIKNWRQTPQEEKTKFTSIDGTTKKNNSAALKNTDAWADNDLDALLAMRDQLTISTNNNNNNNNNKNKKKKKKKKKGKNQQNQQRQETNAMHTTKSMFQTNNAMGKPNNIIDKNKSTNVSDGIPQMKITIMEEPYEEYGIDHSRIHQKYKKFIDNPMKAFTYGEEEEKDKDNNNKEVEKGRKKRPNNDNNNNNNNFNDLTNINDNNQFYQRILRVPNQCMRYAYGSKPLLPPSSKSSSNMNKKSKNTKNNKKKNKNAKTKGDNDVKEATMIPKCQKCNGNRLFEMQLMPSLLSTIEQDTNGNNTMNMNWETILIYSCENSCKDSYEEHVVAIYDPDEELMFNKRANATKPNNRNHNNKVLANSNMDNNKDKTTCNHPIIIRKATNAELPHVVEIINNSFQAAYSHVRSSSLPPPRTTLEKIKYAMDVQGSEVLVCTILDKICGTVLTPSHHHDFESAALSNTSSFGSLAVDIEQQRKGIGSLLVKECEKKAIANGKTRMELCFAHGPLLSNSPDLLLFYKKLGYREKERKERDEWFDILPEFRNGLYFQQMVKML